MTNKHCLSWDQGTCGMNSPSLVSCNGVWVTSLFKPSSHQQQSLKLGSTSQKLQDFCYSSSSTLFMETSWTNSKFSLPGKIKSLYFWELEKILQKLSYTRLEAERGTLLTPSTWNFPLNLSSTANRLVSANGTGPSYWVSPLLECSSLR